MRALALLGIGSPPGWRAQFNCSRRSRRKALYPLMPTAEDFHLVPPAGLPAHPSVAVFADPLLAFAPAAGERRSAKPDISAERASIAKLPHERLMHEKSSDVRTDQPQGCQ